MAKIDLAYSLELNEIIDPIQANEYWLDGIIKNKRGFKCISEKCSARITCKNMDTFADTRKVTPHYIMSTRNNMHSPYCEVFKELEKRKIKRTVDHQKREKSYLGRKVCFHVKRPDSHRIIVNGVSDTNKLKSETEEKKKLSSKYEKTHNSNYYLLNSLVLYYVNSFKSGTIDRDTVEIDFGKNKKYIYPLNKFFMRINNEYAITEKDKKHYVYYGKGVVYKREHGGYDLVFNERFLQSEKKVKCVISQKIINSCKVGQVNRIELLKSSIGKERYIYVLATKNNDDRYKTIFLNIDYLSCFAISEYDLDCLEKIIDDES